MDNNDIPEIQLGRINHLRVVKKVDFGYYLEGLVRGHREEILLPNGEVIPELLSLTETPSPSGVSVPFEGNRKGFGGEASVFLYLDQQERLTATMHTPKAQVGDFAYLEVAWVNNFGAFLDWGLQKDLFVPFREQKMKMQKGHSYIVHIHLDPESYRIMASAKVEKWLATSDEIMHSSDRPRRGDEVDILIQQKTDLGFKVIVNPKVDSGLEAYPGLLYDTQVFRDLHTGDSTRAYISKVREDGKVDLSLTRPGHDGAVDFSEQLLQHIKDHNGFTHLCDKSPAEEIYSIFGVSKQVFKRATGDLYRQRLITIEPDGLRSV